MDKDSIIKSIDQLKQENKTNRITLNEQIDAFNKLKDKEYEDELLKI